MEIIHRLQQSIGIDKATIIGTGIGTYIGIGIGRGTSD